ncbi:ribosomal large subunit pseudouridine synthase B [Clostridium acetireducens DSM 10703]|jgi:23S rRNA pseudouridine2605 synthase|uniref:Pseudouridine synthase n=1 Tax=Clostridium acetireducens DSM 10703 TaxID=1121290 RepID=A0A1E8F2B2_9CLOT|nr:pseudouridine synthase [Clostridium acetireducens]OFI07774.1 ribosomal large subunit pseudouridine synthase B [Clostridium acetireducens DSM 10703]
MKERLQKYMARCGVASRRKCEEIILNKKVKVNNEIICELGYKVDPFKDKVYVNNKLIKVEENKLYIMLNKPIGYISTVKDEKGRKTIIDLVCTKERIYPIGRLDSDTTGLILLTNDGDVYNKIIHPKVEIDKVYLADIKGIPSENEIKNFCSGIDIGGYITAPAKFHLIKTFNGYSKVKLIIHEGKNRQIRKMCNAINHPVINLERIAIGKIKLKNLPLGKWRHLNKKEINYLKTL